MNNLQNAVESLAQAWVAASTKTSLNSTMEASMPPDEMMSSTMSADRKRKKETPATATLSSAIVSTTAVKSTPIKCLIEVVNRETGALKQETDNYAIVPSHSLFKDVVKTVLLKLGHSTQDALAAKGAIQIKNWKPLELSAITDRTEATVENILGNLTTVATLKIRITSRALSEDLKDKLLHLLLTQSQDILHKAGCPISKNDLEKLVSGCGDLSSDMKTSFYSWYQQHTTNLFQAPTVSYVSSTAGNQSPTKSRLRISFDAEQEVPRLTNWFAENAHPSRQQMIKYLDELNGLPCRKSGKPLDLTNIMYWFKNARAAARRNGKSIAEEESMSEDDCRVPVSSAPVLPNKNAVYMVKDPLISSNTCTTPEDDARSGDGSAESDLEDDISMTDDSESVDESAGAQDLSLQKTANDTMLDKVKREAGEIQNPIAGSRSSSASSNSPKSAASLYNMPSMLSGYPFPFGAMPMAYLQSHMNPFYKDMSVKVQSAVAAHATNLHHSASMVPVHKSKNGERQKRHRAFIDPVSEIPKLEQWFIKDTHPSHYVIEQICDELNRGEFRSRYPKLSAKNIQLWFKNHRAKVKRMRVSQHLQTNLSSPGLQSPPMVHH